ncbi:10490_t:CDS:2, partial [Cetraspora pellucida]
MWYDFLAVVNAIIDAIWPGEYNQQVKYIWGLAGMIVSPFISRMLSIEQAIAISMLRRWGYLLVKATNRYSPQELTVSDEKKILVDQIGDAIFDQWPEQFKDSKITHPEYIPYYLDPKMKYSPGLPFLVKLKTRRELKLIGNEAGLIQACLTNLGQLVRDMPIIYSTPKIKIETKFNTDDDLHELERIKGGTGQSATSFDNTWATFIAVWLKYYNFQKPILQFFEENLIYNNGDDSIWGCRIKWKHMDHRLIDAFKEFGMDLEVEFHNDIEFIQYLGNKVYRLKKNFHPDLHYQYRLYETLKHMNKNSIPYCKWPELIVYHDPSATLLRRTSFRYYQGSVQNRNYLHASIQRNCDHAYNAAWNPDLYRMFAYEYIDDLNELARYYRVKGFSARVITDQKLDRKDRYFLQVKIDTPNLKSLTKKKDKLFWEFVRSFKYPTYYQVLNVQLRIHDDVNKYELYYKKFLKGGTILYDILNLDLDDLSILFQSLPRQLYKMQPTLLTFFPGNYLNPSWEEIQQRQLPTMNEFQQLVNQPPVGGYCDSYSFLYNIRNNLQYYQNIFFDPVINTFGADYFYQQAVTLASIPFTDSAHNLAQLIRKQQQAKEQPFERGKKGEVDYSPWLNLMKDKDGHFQTLWQNTGKAIVVNSGTGTGKSSRLPYTLYLLRNEASLRYLQTVTTGLKYITQQSIVISDEFHELNPDMFVCYDLLHEMNNPLGVPIYHKLILSSATPQTVPGIPADVWDTGLPDRFQLTILKHDVDVLNLHQWVSELPEYKEFTENDGGIIIREPFVTRHAQLKKALNDAFPKRMSYSLHRGNSNEPIPTDRVIISSNVINAGIDIQSTPAI